MSNLKELTECSICYEIFKDPRILSCIHTFCLKCLEQFEQAEGKKKGDTMACPLCKTDFVIPDTGVKGLKKNFFMEQLIDINKHSKTETGNNFIDCDVCREKSESHDQSVSTATLRCLECEKNLCDNCSDVERCLKLNSSHQVVKIGSNTGESPGKRSGIKFCKIHNHKELDYYCTQCKRIVCVSCFVETHSSHGCKDVNSVGKDLRGTISSRVLKISSYNTYMLSKRISLGDKKTEFQANVKEAEKLILQRNEELKKIINQHTRSLLGELSSIEKQHLKEIENEIEKFEADECMSVNFEMYCDRLVSVGSASDICDLFDDIMTKADELEKHNYTLLGRPYQKLDVSFKTRLTEVADFFKDNIIGCIEVNREQFHHVAVVVGIYNDSMYNGALKINLQQLNEVEKLQQLPTTMRIEADAAVYNNALYVAGVGEDENEIWKYDFNSLWSQCAYLNQRRRRHCVAFVDEVLYICGGYVDEDGSVLDSVEAYSTINSKCTTVGKLVYPCQSSGNSISFKKSVYIFGGSDMENIPMNHVQVYNTDNNT